MRGLGTALATVSSLLLLALVAELYYLFWRKKHRSRPLRLRTLTPAAYAEETAAPAADVDVGVDNDNDDPLKCIPISHNNIDVELMRLHCLPGPPRFLFTIKEEVDGDADSESGARTHGRSQLRDLLHCQHSPLRAPLSSPPLQLGINPLFDSTTSTSHSPPCATSPPPKFNFLKEAEEKLQRRIALLEASRPQI